MKITIMHKLGVKGLIICNKKIEGKEKLEIKEMEIFYYDFNKFMHIIYYENSLNLFLMA